MASERMTGHDATHQMDHATAGHEHHGGGQGDHAAQFRRRFLVSALLAMPVIGLQRNVLRSAGLPTASGVLGAVDIAVARHGDLHLRRRALPDRRLAGDQTAAAGNDAADLAGDHGGVRCVLGDDAAARRLRPGFLVGARAADRDHAVGALVGDASARRRLGCSRCSRRTAARLRRAGDAAAETEVVSLAELGGR